MNAKRKEKLYLPLLILTGALIFIGLVLIFSASRIIGQSLGALFARQIIWTAIGFAVLAVMARTDFHIWIRNAGFLYFFMLLVLFLVLLFGHGRSETQRWFKLGALYLQPSEPTKILFIFVLGSYIARHKDTIRLFSTIFIAALFFLLPPMFLILMQPNLGTAFVLIPIFFTMFYIAGTPKKNLFALFSMGLAALPLLWLFLKDYQKQRIMVFLSPGVDPLGAGYNLLQSKIAIGSGGFFGKGFLRGTQTHLAFLPEHHTDFIFSVLAEEWGFLGSAILLTAYLVFLMEIIKIASYTQDRAGTIVTVGCGAMFTTQIFVNIAMTMGFLPVVGIPLPFLSYGGSSMITSLAAVGIILNIKSRETFI